jgi:hypothetical protein
LLGFLHTLIFQSAVASAARVASAALQQEE